MLPTAVATRRYFSVLPARATGHGHLCMGAISLLYWAVALKRAASEAFTFDELTTWRIARLPSVGAMWDLLITGADQHVIGAHLLVRWSHRLFGTSHVASRLPAIFGIWLMLVCLYLLLRRYLPDAFALAGAVLPLLTYVWQFAYQARSYGVVLGSSALALLCWRIAAERKSNRVLALAGLAVSLAIALANHMAALTLAVPFAAGEVVRTLKRRRIDYPMWAALILGASPSLVLYPAILAGTADFKLAGLHATFSAMPMFYAEMMQPAILPMIVVAALVIVATWRVPSQPGRALPPSLATALLLLIALPAIFIATSAVSRQYFFVSRYGVFAVIGIAGLFASGASSFCARRPQLGWLVLLVLVGWFAISRGSHAWMANSDPASSFAEAVPLLRLSTIGPAPVVVTDTTTFARADFYLPLGEASHLHYLVDFDNAWRTPGADIAAHILWRMRSSHTARSVAIDSYRDFLKSNKRFLLWTNDNPPEWIYWDLQHSTCEISLLDRTGGESLLLVQCP